MKHNYIAYPMSCFCDIPLSRISEHTAFYGNYGIGLTKDWGLKNKLCPVIYTPPDSSVTKLTDYLFDLWGKEGKEKSSVATNDMIYQMISLIKPLEGNMIIAGAPVEKAFYQESEWRFVPMNGSMLLENDFANFRDQENTRMEQYSLQICPDDIKYLFVKSDHEIPELVDFINTDTKLGHFPHNSLKILTTRILSLDGVSEDL